MTQTTLNAFFNNPPRQAQVHREHRSRQHRNSQLTSQRFTACAHAIRLMNPTAMPQANSRLISRNSGFQRR